LLLEAALIVALEVVVVVMTGLLAMVVVNMHMMGSH